VKRILLLLFIALEVLPFTTLAGSGANDSALRAKATQWMSNTGGLRFLENKGQMMDMQRKPVPNVLYEASSRGMDVYVTTSGLSYVFVKLEKHKKNNSSPVQFKFKQNDDSIIETYCRADMQLVGADIRKENIVKEGESIDRTDYYYGGICPDGILGVHNYQKITIKNIYPGIDWVLHTGKKGLKYDFIVHPGADPSQIKLKYKWTDKPQLQEDGSVKISTPMGAITEGTPISYCSGEQVQTTYIVKDSEIYFNISNYNSTQALIIDPELVWATYYGGGNDDFGHIFDFSSMNADGASVWITGIMNIVNFPTYNPGGGAYFQGFNSSPNTNIFILQFSTAGVLKWATFYGGSSAINYSMSIYSDGANVWLTGYTGSTDLPTFNPGKGAYFQGTLGGENAFILKFSTAGIRRLATFYGGNFSTGLSIQSEGRNVWLTGAASGDLPVFNPGGGAYFQTSPNGDAYVAKFDTSGILKWATFYGGSGNGNGGRSIYSDGIHVWVAGTTQSTNCPTLNPGGGAYFQGTIGGLENIFILKFDTAGVLKWATYYGGKTAPAQPEAYSIQSDGKNVFLTGTTTAPNFPVFNPGGGAYFQPTLYSPNGDGFILQFDTSGIRKWATYYSGTDIHTQEYGYTIQSDGKHVWVSGTTSSADFPIVNTGCGFNQDTIGNIPGVQDVYLSEFSLTGVPIWSTYYGTDDEDDGSGAWINGNNLFVAGDADYKGYPAINPGGGAYYLPKLPDSAVSELPFVGKFILGGITVSSTISICRGQSTTLSASGATYYNWSPPKGLSATNIPNPIASPTVTTTYTVTGIDTGACGGTYIDSIKVIVDTLNVKDIILTPHDTSICSSSSVTLNANGGTNYNWSTGATTSSISIQNDLTTQTYSVSISNGACIKDTDMTVTVVPTPKINLSGNTKICRGESDTITASGGTSYLWSNGYTGSSYAAIINSVTTLTITAYNSSGCSHDTTITITPETPVLSACCNTIIQAGNDTILVAKGNSPPYYWSPKVTCLNPGCDSVKVSPTVTTTYTVMITDSAGCEVERTITVDVELPCTDFIVPNVFTPDYPGLLGVDNLFYIKTSNLSNWSITIYDRWGKEMFHTSNPALYWNGNNESGGKAPDGVYYYIINVTCQNNTFKKDGFVQLIR